MIRMMVNSREYKRFFWPGRGTGLGILGYRYHQRYFLTGGTINKPISIALPPISICKKALSSLSLDFAFSFKDCLPGFKCAPEQAPAIHQITAGVPGTGVLPELLPLLPATLRISTEYCGFLALRAAVPSLDFFAFQQILMSTSF